MKAKNIKVNGIVQGVGFRPFIARLAHDMGCSGWVLNSKQGVEIVIEHEDEEVLGQFVHRIEEERPQAAYIDSIITGEIPAQGFGAFEIRHSHASGTSETLISPDIATCPACIEELFEPDDGRYHYPFINCTNCGPRFTIIEALPYDRPNTSMKQFQMCPSCDAQYRTELDRRYHAQPCACFACGPRLWWMHPGEKAEFAPQGALMPDAPLLSREDSDALIKHAAQALRAGNIVAIKGLGGWYLACDATNQQAVERLRERKHRPSKPLALLVRDTQAAKGLCRVNSTEQELLEGSVRPIVLLARQSRETPTLAPSIAGLLPELGIMLPSTPLQHLLMHELDMPLVMTSGNRSGEPIVARDDQAFEYLGGIADAFLGNNRAIVARYDDSVVRVLKSGEVQVVRRARGYAPAPVPLELPAYVSQTAPVIFAAGSEQKSTFCYVRGTQAYVSQHLGDLEHLGAWRAYEEARRRYEALFDLHANVLACDMHPEYLASKWAREQARQQGLQLVEVQHHHAHIASVLGEHELKGCVIGVALDGTGYGTDGTIWGGEILIASRADFVRFWHLPCFKLPGGAAAILHPDRSAYALLRAYSQLDDPRFSQFSTQNPQFAAFLEDLEERSLLDQMLDQDINSPRCSSMGRLFDAASALLGICKQPSYDGEAACLLEAAAVHERARQAALDSSANAPLTASSFHELACNVIIEQCENARRKTGIKRVVLSGGCMMNRIVAARLENGLFERGFELYKNRKLPPNDGCISYGQAVVAQACVGKDL